MTRKVQWSRLSVNVHEIVDYIRNDVLSAMEASDIVIKMAAIMGFHVNITPKRRTLIFSGLKKYVTCEDIINSTTLFGVAECVGVATGIEGFGT